MTRSVCHALWSYNKFLNDTVRSEKRQYTFYNIECAIFYADGKNRRISFFLLCA